MGIHVNAVPLLGHANVMKSSSPSIVFLLPMVIGEGTFLLVVGGLPISVFSRLLPSVLTHSSLRQIPPRGLWPPGS